MKRVQVRFLWRDPLTHEQFRTAVSLHSHTMHSRESLGFIPRYAAAIPLLAWEIRRQAGKYREKYGRDLDYTKGHWTPPLPGREGYDLERRHIEEKLGFAALVSLTDHDNIDASCELVGNGTRGAPISVEWTVPLGPSWFHVGVHNLPPPDAHSIMEELAGYTTNPSEALRQKLLVHLSRQPGVLIVLNHPLCDQAAIGADRHRKLLRELLDTSDGCIHALELNGLRPWAENQAVMDLARARDHTLVSGGDRHGCEPTSIVNLTGATSFPEFVSEVRAGRSEIALLNHYREPLGFRLLKSVCDIMGEYPELPGRIHWYDRVYCRLRSGTIAPLSQAWTEEFPRVIRYFDRAIRLTGNRRLRAFLRHCFANGQPK
jgi:hypothetical protein